MKKVLGFIAVTVIVFAACTTPGKNTAIGTGAGMAVGAGAGAIIASTTGGNAGQGAVWGAAAGAVLGAGVGNYFDKQAKELAKLATVVKTDNGLIITMNNDILFETGKADLSADAKKNIADMSRVFKKYPCNILEVQGHTDSTGTVAGNQSLSERRATAVLNELSANQVKTVSMIAKGYGQNYPVASNTTAEGRSQNRRVNLVITANADYVKQYCK